MSACRPAAGMAHRRWGWWRMLQHLNTVESQSSLCRFGMHMTVDSSAVIVQWLDRRCWRSCTTRKCGGFQSGLRRSKSSLRHAAALFSSRRDSRINLLLWFRNSIESQCHAVRLCALQVACCGCASAGGQAILDARRLPSELTCHLSVTSNSQQQSRAWQGHAHAIQPNGSSDSSWSKHITRSRLSGFAAGNAAILRCTPST